MPKWVKQVISSIMMLLLMIAALYLSGKEAGNMDLLYHFLILVTAIAYIVSIFCVSFDAEVRGASVFWVSFFCCALPLIGHLAWLFIRPQERYSFAEYLVEEEEVLAESSTVEHE